MKKQLVALVLLATLALGTVSPVTAYHIDAPWPPVDSSTGINTNCPQVAVPPPDQDPGTQCSNAPARGWVVGPLGIVVCEQNRPGATPGTPATNGMCFASNQDANTSRSAAGVTGPCDDGGMFDPTRNRTGQTPITSHISYFNDTGDFIGPCLDKHAWTKLWVFDSFNEDFNNTVTGAAGRPCPEYSPLDPHACIPTKGNVYVQARIGSNAHGILLTPRDNGNITKSPALCDATGSGFPNTFGGIDGANRTGRCDPRGDGPWFTFYYRELTAYWLDGGHATFFVQQPATQAHNDNAPVMGSYWAMSLPPGDTPQDDNGCTQNWTTRTYASCDPDRTGLVGLECNKVFDDRVWHDDGVDVAPLGYANNVPGGTTTKVYRGTARAVAGGPTLPSYYNVFEPVTYVAMKDPNVNATGSVPTFLDDAATTVCRGNSNLSHAFNNTREPSFCFASEDVPGNRGCDLKSPGPCARQPSTGPNGEIRVAILCKVDRACDGKKVVAFADLRGGNFARARVFCGDPNSTAATFDPFDDPNSTAPIVNAFDDTANGAPVNDPPPLQPEKRKPNNKSDYWCVMTFEGPAGVPPKGSAHCRDP